MFINIPSKELYDQLTQVLESKYGLKFTRRFTGFRVETGSTAVVVVSASNINYVAHRIAEVAKRDKSGVIEIFRNNTGLWKFE